MIPQEREPRRPRRGVAWLVLQVARHRALRHSHAQLEKLAVNPPRAPGAVLGRHSVDEIADLLTRTGSSNPNLHTGAQSPVQSEARPVPSHHGVWLHDDERVGPLDPDSPQHDPKEPIAGGQSRVWMAARQDRELLP